MVARYAGPRPPPALLRRIKKGQVGGVILFADNTAAGVPATHEAIEAMQADIRAKMVQALPARNGRSRYVETQTIPVNH